LLKTVDVVNRVRVVLTWHTAKTVFARDISLLFYDGTSQLPLAATLKSAAIRS